MYFLQTGVVGISEIIIRPGLINVDFADVRTIMGDAGTALMGIGKYVLRVMCCVYRSPWCLLMLCVCDEETFRHPLKVRAVFMFVVALLTAVVDMRRNPLHVCVPVVCCCTHVLCNRRCCMILTQTASPAATATTSVTVYSRTCNELLPLDGTSYGRYPVVLTPNAVTCTTGAPARAAPRRPPPLPSPRRCWTFPSSGRGAWCSTSSAATTSPCRR
jgi:hypothetical protein